MKKWSRRKVCKLDFQKLNSCPKTPVTKPARVPFTAALTSLLEEAPPPKVLLIQTKETEEGELSSPDDVRFDREYDGTMVSVVVFRSDVCCFEVTSDVIFNAAETYRRPSAYPGRKRMCFRFASIAWR